MKSLHLLLPRKFKLTSDFRFITLFFSFFLFISQLSGNPFAIDFPTKEYIDNQDYINIQEQLRTIDINPLLHELYPSNQGFTTYEDFYGRCSRGILRVLIDEDKGFIPEQNLVKIGNGGDNCFVSCAPYDGVRTVWFDKILKGLQNTGFNGYFYYRKGGFPNPTGKEIKYAGVPYCFKIFMMLEASKIGFKKVIWIDSACLPLHDPTFIFEWVDQHGSLFRGSHYAPDRWKYILPATYQLLKHLTGTDILNDRVINTGIFGLKMDTELADKLIPAYYQLVELGTPFLSCFPEEFAITSILGRHDVAPLWDFCPWELLRGSDNNNIDTEESIQARKDQGFLFYHLRQ